MEKEFVPYGPSFRMKVIGFNEPCFSYYDLNNKPNFFGADGLMDTHCVQVNRPTFSQAFRWFREKHGLQGYVYSTTVRGGKEGKHFSDYCWHINGIDMPFLSTDARDMENVSYEEAELACLEKLIEIVESKS